MKHPRGQVPDFTGSIAPGTRSGRLLVRQLLGRARGPAGGHEVRPYDAMCFSCRGGVPPRPCWARFLLPAEAQDGRGWTIKAGWTGKTVEERVRVRSWWGEGAVRLRRRDND